MPAAVGSQGVREGVNLHPPARRVLRRGAERRRRPDGRRRAEGDEGSGSDNSDRVPFRLPRRVLARQLIERLAVAKCQKDLTLWVGLLRSDDPESIKGVIEAVCAKSRVFGGGDRSNE